MNRTFKLYLACDESDNSALENGDKWADRLARNLLTAIGELSGVEIPAQAADQFDRTVPAILLVVISGKSCGSRYLNGILTDFYRLKKMDANWECRIFKILKEPVKYEQQPEPIRRLEGFEFFQPADAVSGRYSMDVQENNPDTKEYWMQVSDLAYSIFETFRQNRQPGKGCVYLASVSPDIFAHRQAVKRELIRRGICVLPDQTYPDDPETAKRLISNDLISCSLSLHMIGQLAEENLYQSFPLGEIQFQAASAGDDPNLVRIAWALPSCEFIDERQKNFYALVRRDMEKRQDAFVFQSSVEELKEMITKLVVKKNIPGREEPVLQDGQKRKVYLVYESGDAGTAKAIAKGLGKLGYTVIEPVFDLEYAAVQQAHRENLMVFDVALIVCKNCCTEWLQMKLMEIMRSPGYGRTKPLLSKIVVAQGASIDMKKISNVVADTVILPDKINEVFLAALVEGSAPLRMVKMF